MLSGSRSSTFRFRVTKYCAAMRISSQDRHEQRLQETGASNSLNVHHCVDADMQHLLPQAQRSMIPSIRRSMQSRIDHRNDWKTRWFRCITPTDTHSIVLPWSAPNNWQGCRLVYKLARDRPSLCNSNLLPSKWHKLTEATDVWRPSNVGAASVNCRSLKTRTYGGQSLC